MVKLASKSMFSRLFASVNPTRTNLELLQFNWEALLQTYDSFDKSKFWEE